MKSIRFGIDIDGTVTCPTSLIQPINEQFGVQLQLQDITAYDLTEVVDVKAELFHQWYKQSERELLERSILHSNAQDVLTEWTKQFELFYISARGSDLLDSTINWFKEHQIPFDHIELIGSHDKISTAQKYGVQAFFEDKHDNAIALHEALNIPVFLFDTPYNRLPIPQGVIRVHNWTEAKQWVHKMFLSL